MAWNVTVATYRNTKAQIFRQGTAIASIGQGEVLTLVAAASCLDTVTKQCRSRRQKPAARQAAEEVTQGSNLIIWG